MRIIAAVFLALCLAGAVQAATAPVEDKIVARINTVTVTERQLEEAVDDFIPRASYHGNVTPEKRAEFRPKALAELVRNELYYQDAVTTGYKVDPAEVEEGLKTIRSRFKNEAQFKKALKASGQTVEALSRRIEKELLVRQYVATEIDKKSVLSDEEVRNYYDVNKNDFKRPEAVRLRHILIKVEPTATAEERIELRKKAEDVLKRAKAGEDFGELAYAVSMDMWGIKGGDLGLVHRGRLDPDVEKAAFQLEAGQISDIVETIYGFHIVKVEEKVAPTQLGFDEVAQGLRKRLEQKKRKDTEEALLKRLKDKSTIEYY